MHSIWAVAKNTIRQAVRLKIVAVFTVLLLVLLPVMGSAMTGDGTLKGRLQTFVSYGLSLTALLLSLLTIAVSIYSLTSDLTQCQIYTVLTKPIRRFELIIGKLLGVIVLDTVLLFFFAGLIYAITLAIPRFSKPSPEQLAQANNEFYTARASLVPADVDVSKEVEEKFKKGIKDGILPQQAATDRRLYNDVITSLTIEAQKDKRSAVPASELVWNFNNVKPAQSQQNLFLRFKYDVSVNPPDLKITGKWVVGDIRQYGKKVKTPVYSFQGRELIRTFHELQIPADAVAEDGYLAVVFFNDSQENNTVVIFPQEDGLEILYKADSYTWNFVRATLLIFFRLVFFACLGVLSATFLSFPVAIMLCVVVFFTGTISGFILDSFDTLNENVGVIYYYTVRPLIQLLPQFDRSNPSDYLVPSKLLTWSLVVKTGLSMVVIKSVLLFFISLLIFAYKEIAKVII